MPRSVDYRPGRPTDAMCVGVLATQVFLDTYATDGIRPDLALEVTSVCSPQAFSRRLMDPGLRFVLAEVDGHLVAFAELAIGSACPGPVGAAIEIVRLYVQRGFQRRGIGAALSRHAESIAAAGGAASVWLTAWSGNAQALAFYRALGYRDVGATTYAIADRAYENRILVKPLAPGADDAPQPA